MGCVPTGQRRPASEVAGLVGRYATMGNKLFIIGVALEIAGLVKGVHPTAVALGLIAYGVVLLFTGYLR